jgi:hypothetical protein
VITTYPNSNSFIESQRRFWMKRPDYKEQKHYIHVECEWECRPAIILLEADCKGYLPLHMLLCSWTSSTEDALMMIEKYPAALQHPIKIGSLPLPIELIIQCRSSIILKCIELYPEALDDRAITIVIEQVDLSNFRRYSSALSIIFSARPMSLYDHGNKIGHDIRHNSFYRRRILNLLPRHVFTPTHEVDYRDLYWHSRLAMIMLLSYFRHLELSSNGNGAAILIESSVNQPISNKWHQQRCLLLHIIKTSALLLHPPANVKDSFSICQHVDVGDVLLRSIFGFL